MKTLDEIEAMVPGESWTVRPGEGVPIVLDEAKQKVASFRSCEEATFVAAAPDLVRGLVQMARDQRDELKNLQRQIRKFQEATRVPAV